MRARRGSSSAARVTSAADPRAACARSGRAIPREACPLLLLALLVPAQSDAARPVGGTVRTLLRPLGGVTVVVPDLGRFSVTDSLAATTWACCRPVCIL
jgi:hypothetical protein